MNRHQNWFLLILKTAKPSTKKKMLLTLSRFFWLNISYSFVVIMATALKDTRKKPLVLNWVKQKLYLKILIFKHWIIFTKVVTLAAFNGFFFNVKSTWSTHQNHGMTFRNSLCFLNKNKITSWKMGVKQQSAKESLFKNSRQHALLLYATKDTQNLIWFQFFGK